MALSTLSKDEIHPRMVLEPLSVFPNQSEFVRRHEQGTLIEMENEAAHLRRLNELRHLYRAWPIAPIPGLKTSFATSWLLLVNVPSSSEDISFPVQNDRFTIDMEASIVLPHGTYTLVHLLTTRVPNPYETAPQFKGTLVQKYAAFKVDVPRSWKTNAGEQIELDLMAPFQVAPAIDELVSISMDSKNAQHISIRWDICSQTFEAEIAALHYLVDEKRNHDKGPSINARNAFKMLLKPDNRYEGKVNLHKRFPQLKDPSNPTFHVPRVLLEKFSQFNDDHLAAYTGLSKIRNGIYFVNGCPGAGKTEWNMILSGLIHARSRNNPKSRKAPILFLVDINQTATDAADRYYRLCNEAGLQLSIIRMHGWPYEMQNSDRLNQSDRTKENVASESNMDFTKNFLTTVGLAQHTKLERDRNRAPTLDEAAWEYFERHKHDAFPTLRKLIMQMESGQVFGNDDWKNLRKLVSKLYREVLAHADFVATTPVAASGGFTKLFRPEIVFIDEAPHARELTTLIPLVYFDPVAWIFTGDVKQTRPFVKSGSEANDSHERSRFNPFSEQLRISTMARVALMNALDRRLLINNRAYGNLHRLPSSIFYDNQMTTSYKMHSMYPASTLHLKHYLEALGSAQGNHEIHENRVVINISDSSEEARRKSFWNPRHHSWVVGQVQTLLKDANFSSISSEEAPGTILIETPYSTAFQQYQAEVKQWPKDWQDRVQVLTVDRAQGSQADVVFLDMVRTTSVGFMDDPLRLNVAITRARQAEVIIMHIRMNYRGKGLRLSQYVSKIWVDAVTHGRLIMWS